MNITSRYRSNWINVQQARWAAPLADKGVPRSGWVESNRAAALARSIGSSGPDFALDGFSCSTVALLGLLARWSATLQTAECKSAALAMAQAILLAGLPSQFVWPVAWEGDNQLPQHCYPLPPGAAQAECRVSDGQVDLQPLQLRAPGARNLRMPRLLPLAEAMSLLYKAAGQLARKLFWQLICWLAFLLEGGAWIEGSSADHLTAPLPMGNVRRRDIPRRVRDAVGEAAGSGQIGRSGRAVMAVMHRFSRRQAAKMSNSGRAANKYLVQRVKQYWHKVRSAFRAPGARIFSIALDATRVAGKDMLFQALYVPELGAAAWLPPQARLKDLATLPPAFPRERRRTAERAESATQKREKRDAENGRAKRRRKQSGDPRRKREENTKKTRRKRVRFDDSFTFWTPKGDAKNDEENTKKTRRKQENGNEENEETDIFFTALSAFEWPS